MYLKLSFEKAHYLVITEEGVFKADDISEDLAEMIHENLARVIALDDLVEITLEGNLELPDFEDSI